MVIFDYSFESSDSASISDGLVEYVANSAFDTINRESYGVLAMDTGLTLPTVSVVPEGAGSRMANLLTAKQVDLEWEDFNRAFAVRGEDPKGATDLLTPAMMELLMREPRLGWSTIGHHLMIIQPGAFAADHILVGLELLTQSIAGVPEHLRVALGT